MYQPQSLRVPPVCHNLILNERDTPMRVTGTNPLEYDQSIMGGAAGTGITTDFFHRPEK
jgi:hypothetical protein